MVQTFVPSPNPLRISLCEVALKPSLNQGLCLFGMDAEPMALSLLGHERTRSDLVWSGSAGASSPLQTPLRHLESAGP